VLEQVPGSVQSESELQGFPGSLEQTAHAQLSEFRGKSQAVPKGMD
jgi:hypothetical protein